MFIKRHATAVIPYIKKPRPCTKRVLVVFSPPPVQPVEPVPAVPGPDGPAPLGPGDARGRALQRRRRLEVWAGGVHGEMRN